MAFGPQRMVCSWAIECLGQPLHSGPQCQWESEMLIDQQHRDARQQLTHTGPDLARVWLRSGSAVRCHLEMVSVWLPTAGSHMLPGMGNQQSDLTCFATDVRIWRWPWPWQNHDWLLCPQWLLFVTGCYPFPLGLLWSYASIQFGHWTSWRPF